jgi:1-pyrroline-5-carboxylate dehydrogenase
MEEIAMADAISRVPRPSNEPIKGYGPGSEERRALRSEIERLKAETIDIPLVIGGREIKTGKTGKALCPHNHRHVLASYHMAGEAEAGHAAEAANEAWEEWSRTPWEARAAVFLRAADLLSGELRYTVNAAAMLDLSKTIYQAEIDAACELIDFFRFNVHYMTKIYEEQPDSGPGMWNRMDYRPLEGFVFAATPFNFVSIAGNLPTAPVIMGNTVIWKPASTAVFSGYHIMRLLLQAGLPDGVINFLPGPGSGIGPRLLKHRDLAGVHFTGSTETFRGMWRTIGANIECYKSYPRIVGETGGKDFFFVHPSYTEIDRIAAGIVRGAFEYQGQKCSSASRGYIPKSLWPRLKKRLKEITEGIDVGDVEDFSNFMGAVIDEQAFRKHKEYIELARSDADHEVVAGGKTDDSVGWFVRPTVVETRDPKSRLMEEEIFGPIFTVWIYDDSEYERTLSLCNETSIYGLTGCIWAEDRYAIRRAFEICRHAAGNFYINDKPTAAVVGRQPFGGGRASGTNDKAGSVLNLLRWTTPLAIKETFQPPDDYRYPHMREE